MKWMFLGVFQAPEARQDVTKCSDFQLHCSSHTYSFISLLIYHDCPQLTLSMSECYRKHKFSPKLGQYLNFSTHGYTGVTS